MIIALKAEARPLVARYRLEPASGQRGVYFSDGGKIALAISGVGRRNAASAVERLYGMRTAGTPSAWLNVGIAGHASEARGTALIAHEVLERSTGLRVYPCGPMPASLSATALCTVDEPEAVYETGWAYDMEGSGFMRAALAICAAGPVHCVKIVSDGPQRPWESLSATAVEELIGAHTESIESVLEDLGAMPHPIDEGAS